MDRSALQQLKLCLYLARMEFDKRFAGSFGGRAWVFVGPLLTIAIIWIALDFGLGLRATAGREYGVTLAVGLCAWIFFAEAINTSVASIISSPHLVKKVVFPVVLLPLSTVAAAFAVHLLVLGVVGLVLLLQGQSFGWSLLTLPFWALCLLLLTGAAAISVAGLNVLFRDMSALVPNIVSFLFWLTPIVWPIANLPNEWRSLVFLNPVAVIIEGYRGALLGSTYGIGLGGSVTFCAALGMILLGSVSLFRKIRPWFANVL
jgi:ABC-type polysaccharide/polyol phosphate export permease